MKITSSILSMLLLSFMFVANASGSNSREWSFRVLLDGKPVGEQHFVATSTDGTTRLETEASFKVKFLFATVYKYTHKNVETWEGDCLAGIQSSTDANGKNFSVTGKKRDGFFEVAGKGESEKLPACVMSFAYWNPSFLEHSQLLNSQDGEYLDVEVSQAEPDVRIVRGEEVPAIKYQINEGKLDLQLWYSEENEWLALESRTEGNRVLSYELL